MILEKIEDVVENLNEKELKEIAKESLILLLGNGKKLQYEVYDCLHYSINSIEANKSTAITDLWI